MEDMKKRIVRLLSVVLAFVMSLGATAFAASAPIAQTRSGSVAGLSAGDLNIFKGIPYARPAVRFAPPEDPQPWTGVRGCLNFSAVAPQDVSRINNPLFPKRPMSELDSLTLNIWAPAQAAGLPVYVWIHGGGFAIGSSAEPIYDGATLAREGIVVVSINYRLNALGFLATRETLRQYGTTGNWGLLDQIKALEWVRENIAAFGGDPSRVTIGGQSAGSLSVSALILSPLARGLFHGAIMESGSILGAVANTQYARSNLERSIEVGRQLMFSFGAQDNARGLAKLREADPMVLSGMSPLALDLTMINPYLMTPVFDGLVMPKEPVEALKDGEINKVNLLWGFTSDEALPFIPAESDTDRYKTFAAAMFGYDKSLEILEKFPVSEEKTAYQRTREILSHGIFSTVMKPFADAEAASGAKVFGYYFDYAPELAKLGLGAPHGDEIQYVFGNLPPKASRAQKKLSQDMLARWANFIKYGDPNGGEGSAQQWAPYDPSAMSMMIFREKPTFGELPVRDDVLFMENVLFGPEATQFK